MEIEDRTSLIPSGQRHRYETQANTFSPRGHSWGLTLYCITAFCFTASTSYRLSRFDIQNSVSVLHFSPGPFEESVYNSCQCIHCYHESQQSSDSIKIASYPHPTYDLSQLIARSLIPRESTRVAKIARVTRPSQSTEYSPCCFASIIFIAFTSISWFVHTSQNFP